MSGYEIRFSRDDDTLSLIVKPHCTSAEEAMRIARDLFAPGFAKVEVWKDMQRIAVKFPRPLQH